MQRMPQRAAVKKILRLASGPSGALEQLPDRLLERGRKFIEPLLFTDRAGNLFCTHAGGRCKNESGGRSEPSGLVRGGVGISGSRG
jgi:hypothetical protein